MANPQHATLVANTPRTFDFGKHTSGYYEVTNVDGAAAVYIATGADVTPTVGTDGYLVIPAAVGSRRVHVTSSVAKVTLVSSGTPVVSVWQVQE